MSSYMCTEALVAKLLPSLPSVSFYVCMYYEHHNHTVIAEPMAVDICKYKMWAFTINSICMLHSPIQCPKVKQLAYQDT